MLALTVVCMYTMYRVVTVKLSHLRFFKSTIKAAFSVCKPYSTVLYNSGVRIDLILKYLTKYKVYGCTAIIGDVIFTYAFTVSSANACICGNLATRTPSEIPILPSFINAYLNRICKYHNIWEIMTYTRTTKPIMILDCFRHYIWVPYTRRRGPTLPLK